MPDAERHTQPHPECIEFTDGIIVHGGNNHRGHYATARCLACGTAHTTIDDAADADVRTMRRTALHWLTTISCTAGR